MTEFLSGNKSKSAEKKNQELSLDHRFGNLVLNSEQPNLDNSIWDDQYNELKRSTSRITNQELFVDPYFDVNSLNISSTEKITWLRPKDLVSKPKLGSSSTNYKDVLQGRLDNCALLSACSSIASYPHLVKQIFEDDTKLHDENYRGFVKLRLWLNNKWTNVIIDDRLPTLNNDLVFSKCKNKNHFWVPLLEKAFAKIQQGYINLIGIDSAFCLTTLTSGLTLRYNPVNLNQKEKITKRLDELKNNNILIAIMGSELTNASPGSSNRPKSALVSAAKRIGHSFSLIDIVVIQSSMSTSEQHESSFLRLRNSQISMRVVDPNCEDLGEFVGLDAKKAESDRQNGVFYIHREDMFKYFEILTVLIFPDQRPENVLSLNGQFIDIQNLGRLSSENEIPIESYLNSPHYLIELKNYHDKKQELINTIFNVTCSDTFSSNDYMGMFLLPVREYREEKSNYFVIYQFQTLNLMCTNPFVNELDLLPGRYLLSLVMKSEHMPKRFSVRIKLGASKSVISQQRFIQRVVSNTLFLMVEESPFEMIKVVVKKCCVCERPLNRNFLNDLNSNSYCVTCFNASFKCELCNHEVGNDYYTIENRLTCISCFNSKFNV